jgi:hypothetical protein
MKEIFRGDMGERDDDSPGRKGMTWEENDWVDFEATSPGTPTTRRSQPLPLTDV